MSISSVPTYHDEQTSGKGNRKKDKPGNAYIRVMKGTEAALRPSKSPSGFKSADIEINRLAADISINAMRAACTEQSGVVDMPEDADYEGNDTGAVALPVLDYDDVHDTEPGIPEGCLAAEDEKETERPVPKTFDEDGNRIFDLENPWHEGE